MYVSIVYVGPKTVNSGRAALPITGAATTATGPRSTFRPCTPGLPHRTASTGERVSGIICLILPDFLLPVRYGWRICVQKLPAEFDRNSALYFMPEGRITEHVQTKEPELMRDLMPLLRRGATGARDFGAGGL